MQKAMLLVLFLLFCSAVSAFDLNGLCTDVNQQGDFNAIGDCLLKGVFAGDAQFFGIIFLLIFAMFAFEARLPWGATIGIGLILAFALLAPGTTLNQADILISLAVLATAAMLIIAIIRFVKR